MAQPIELYILQFFQIAVQSYEEILEYASFWAKKCVFVCVFQKKAVILRTFCSAGLRRGLNRRRKVKQMADGHMTHDGWRCDKKQEHLHRAKWMDYQAPSIQLLTLVTTDRRPLFGQLQGEQIILSPLGQKVAEEIERIPNQKDASSIEIYKYVVMPDHVHILLRIHDRQPKHIGQYIRWFKLKCTDACLDLGAVPPSKNTPTFAPEYHDRVLSGKDQLAHMAQYIQDNPRRLAMKRANPDLFRINQTSRIGDIPCTTLGNIFLADYPQRAVLQCSRRLTQAEIDARKAQCLAEAANGTVYVSAAISEGEKQISRALREAGYPMIILLEKGFPTPDSPHYRYFKPQGVYFEACAAGKLLLVEPAQEALERPSVVSKVQEKVGNIPRDSLRFRFVAMNALADEICSAFRH